MIEKNNKAIICIPVKSDFSKNQLQQGIVLFACFSINNVKICVSHCSLPFLTQQYVSENFMCQYTWVLLLFITAA